MSQAYMHLYLKNCDFLFLFFALGCLKPHDWGILQHSCCRWLHNNLPYNQREAWKATDLQIREKAVVAVLRLLTCFFFFPAERVGQILPSLLWGHSAGCRVEALSLAPHAAHRGADLGSSPLPPFSPPCTTCCGHCWGNQLARGRCWPQLAWTTPAAPVRAAQSVLGTKSKVLLKILPFLFCAFLSRINPNPGMSLGPQEIYFS